MKRTPLRRSSRVRPRNPERKSKNWIRSYGSVERVEWVKKQGCVVCGAVPSENAHTDTGGMGRKADAEMIVPLCEKHHWELHRFGSWTFQKTHTIDLYSAAKRTEAAWRRFNGEAAA